MTEICYNNLVDLYVNNDRTDKLDLNFNYAKQFIKKNNCGLDVLENYNVQLFICIHKKW